MKRILLLLMPLFGSTLGFAGGDTDPCPLWVWKKESGARMQVARIVGNAADLLGAPETLPVGPGTYSLRNNPRCFAEKALGLNLLSWRDEVVNGHLTPGKPMAEAYWEPMISGMEPAPTQILHYHPAMPKAHVVWLNGHVYFSQMHEVE